MTCADRVDIVLLHEPNIRDHRLGAYVMAGVGVVLVAVYALDENGFAVYE